MTKTKKYFIFGTNKKFIILFMTLKKLKCLYLKNNDLKKNDGLFVNKKILPFFARFYLC